VLKIYFPFGSPTSSQWPDYDGDGGNGHQWKDKFENLRANTLSPACLTRGTLYIMPCACRCIQSY